MRERRSMAQALNATTMSPEKVAFIQDVRTKRELEHNKTVSQESSPPQNDMVPDSSQVIPKQVPEIIGETLVPITTRLSRATANSLKRAHLERKLQGKPLNTQQEIIEIAVADWLRARGHL